MNASSDQMMELHSRAGVPLRRVNSVDRLSSDGGVYAYIVVHNERMRIPFMLDYYRGIGVKHFFFVDDKSNDGTREYLLAQAEQGDISIFESPVSFKEARSGLEWVETLMDNFSHGRWALKVDADEILIYEGVDRVPIQSVTEHLESLRYGGMLSYMLDFYPSQPLSEVSYEPGTPFWASAPYFDPEILVTRRHLRRNSSPNVMITGGSRARLFYPDLYPLNGLKLSCQRLARGINTISKKLGRGAVLSADVPPILEKVPLLRWFGGRSRFISPHCVDKVSVSNRCSALLHFKYLGDFHAKVIEAVQRGQYFDDASEYKRYAEVLLQNPKWSMMGRSSVHFAGVPQLVELGLLEGGGWV